MLNEKEIEELRETYLYSNTPMFLFENFRKSESVKTLALNEAQELVKAFAKIGKDGIENLDQLVLEYAIYVAMTYKSYNEAAGFYNNEGKVNFEWFKDLREIFFAKNRPTIMHTFKIGSPTNKPRNTRFESKGVNDSVEELNV